MRYYVATPFAPRAALKQALAAFGPGGLGLQLTSSQLTLVFQGGGGHIMVTALPGAATLLEVDTRGWDQAVRQFLVRVQRRRPWWQRWCPRPWGRRVLALR